LYACLVRDEVETRLAATRAIAGPELGGIPLATVCSHASGLPTLLVRKQAKTYVACRLAEDGAVAGRRLAVIEDVVTSGGQAIDSGRSLREQGAEIPAVVCVIDRECASTAAESSRSPVVNSALSSRAAFARFSRPPLRTALAITDARILAAGYSDELLRVRA
jgi:orotate phosphoribosyltransferase